MKFSKIMLLGATFISGFSFINSANADLYTYTTDTDLGNAFVLENKTDQQKKDNTVIYVKGATVTAGEKSVITGNKADIGGAFAVSSTAGSLLKIGSGTVLKNNSAYFDGGAVANYGGAIIAENVTFENNSAQEGAAEDVNSIGGGAMALGALSETTITKSTFNSNTSGYNGGAIGTRRAKNDDSTNLNNNGGSLTISDSVFTGNSASSTLTNAKGQLVAGYGGAIYNSLKTTISNTDFTSNSATNNGGAIYNAADRDLYGRQGDMTITGGSFEGNNSDNFGGAIFNGGSMSITGATFDSNTAAFAGAISTGTKSEKMEIADTTFSNNSATEIGAIALYGKNSELTNVTFTGNKATSGASNSDGAGALFLGALSRTVLDNVTFDSNTSATKGGAIATRTADMGNNKDAKLDILNSTFKNNIAATNGGAFDNFLYSSVQNETAVYMDNITFEANKAANGGAIYNHGEGDLGGNVASMIVSNATFTDNNASANGGAIYNMAGAGMTFEGLNTFSGNKDANGLNDIHNDGLIAVANGAQLQLDGGISGTGSIEFAAGSKLQVNTNGTFISNDVTNNGVELSMVFANAYTGTYEMVTGTVTGAFGDVENSLYNIVETDTLGTFEISTKSTGEIAENIGANSEQASVIEAVLSGTSDTNDSFNEAADSIVAMLQNDETKAEGLKQLSAMSTEDAPIVSSSQTNLVNQVYAVVSGRMSGGSVNVGGKSSGDALEDAAMWAQGMVNHTKLDGQFNTDTKGLAFGFEKYVNDDVKAGISYAFAKTDIDSYSRDTQVKTHSAIAYAEYKPANWFVNGILSYSFSDYEEDKVVAGVNGEADYKADTIAAQVVAGYDYVRDNSIVTPTLGLRYMNVERDSYTDALGTTVASNTMDTLTAIFGVKYATTYVVNEMTLMPEIRAAVTYDLVRDDDNALVSLANGSAYTVNNSHLKRFGYELGAGVTTAVDDNVELGVAYEGKFRKDYQDHTGVFNVRYNF